MSHSTAFCKTIGHKVHNRHDCWRWPPEKGKVLTNCLIPQLQVIACRGLVVSEVYRVPGTRAFQAKVYLRTERLKTLRLATGKLDRKLIRTQFIFLLVHGLTVDTMGKLASR